MSQDKMKKIVLKLELHDDKTKQKAMKAVSGLSGVDSIAMDMKDKKLTVTGDIDPINLVGKLKKLCRTEILTVGPAKEPEKKKDEPKKEDQKKTDSSKDKKADAPKADAAVTAYPIYHNHYPPPLPPPYYQAYNYNHQPHMDASYYAKPVEEYPSSCVIC